MAGASTSGYMHLMVWLVVNININVPGLHSLIKPVHDVGRQQGDEYFMTRIFGGHFNLAVWRIV